MALMERPIVTTLSDGGKCWEHKYERFYFKDYVPANDIDGSVNNYTFRAPLLFVFEEKQQTMEEAVAFAKSSGLERVAAEADGAVAFVYPTAEGGWKNAELELFKDLMAEVKMVPEYADGIAESNNFFSRTFEGYYIRGAKFRTDIYSFGESADFVAKYMFDTIDGEYLWGPGSITPAMCSMERLSVKPRLMRKDVAVLSVGNSDEINESFEGLTNLLIKDKADYYKDFHEFVWKYRMWCDNIDFEPDLQKMGMVEERGSITVKTSSDNRSKFKGTKEHTAGYFAYYNKGIMDDKKVPLMLGLHGGGDSALFFTYVAGWYQVAADHDFLLVSIENHHFFTATELVDIVDELQKRYSIDEKRIYATGFSMGSCKTWELIKEYPEKFAGFAPASALPPVKNNVLAQSFGDRFNTDVSVPIFYSGGEQSPLPELPFQTDTALERIQYVAELNDLKAVFDKKFEDKDSYEDPIWTVKGDRIEKLHDETRGSILTVHYFDSKDGVCRTALGSIDNQQHECRHHSCEAAWNFISQFENERV